LEDATRLSEELIRELKTRKAIPQDADALRLHESIPAAVVSGTAEVLGVRSKTLASELLAAIERQREAWWRQHVREVNWELFDRGVESFTWYSLEETVRAAQSASLLEGSRRGSEAERFAKASLDAQLGKPADAAAFAAFHTVRDELEEPMRKRNFFWPRRTGNKGPLVDDERGRVLQVPG